MSGYQKIAQLLSDLPRADQTWLLDQLAVDDRVQVERALSDLAAERSAPAISVQREMEPAESTPTAVEVLRRWDGGKLAVLLADEPLWVAALVLVCLDRAHAETVLGCIALPHSKAMWQAFERMERPGKAHVLEAAAAALVKKAQGRPTEYPSSDNFEDTLARASQEQQRSTVA